MNSFYEWLFGFCLPFSYSLFTLTYSLIFYNKQCEIHYECIFLRKEVIQPHLPIRLPCYDFTPITDPTFDSSLLAVGPLASGVADFRGVTGGVYKARERIHPGVLIRDY